ncbi:hypothetical protein MRB53_041239 [Persea americana]|nr:hypothetical protein MRB53_041239 [Persea americana]
MSETKLTRSKDRRSIALFQSPNPNFAESPNSVSPAPPATTDSQFPPPRSPGPSSGIIRSQTVVYRDTHRNREIEPIYENGGGPSPLWSPNTSQLPTPNEQDQELGSDLMPMNSGQGKTSSDSGSAQTGLDRWSQRRLQRLNTEQGFREQRQGGGGAAAGGSGGGASGNHVLSPTTSDHYPSNNGNTAQEYAQPQSQPQQQYPPAKASLRPATNSNNNNNSHSNHISPNYAHDPSHHPQQSQQSQQHFTNPPQDALSQYQARQAQQAAVAQQSRNNYSNSQQQQANTSITPPQDSEPLSMGNNNHSNSQNNGGGLGKSGNRQSVHNALMSREGSNVSSQGVPPQTVFNQSTVVPTLSQASLKSDTSQQQGNIDPRRNTPQPLVNGEDMSEDEIGQLIKDHKELPFVRVGEVYHHGWPIQSTRMLSLRGKQEMTAAGRAFISCWLVEEVFDKYFHPDLEPALSAQLKSVQRNIRRFAPHAQTAEEEDYLIAKIVNWRLATLEGLQDALRSPQCPTFRAQMTDMLKEHLCGALAIHLQDPPPSDLEGGVHMIVELVVSIAIHLPLESRDVVIEYYMPSHVVSTDQMKLESGIPPLTVSIADDAAERASMKSATSEIDNSDAHEQQGKKRGMLSALTGSGGKQRPAQTQQSGQKQSASGSSTSLQRPESAQGKDETPRVRMAAGIGVSIRGRSVLVKAPVFGT